MTAARLSTSSWSRPCTRAIAALLLVGTGLSAEDAAVDGHAAQTPASTTVRGGAFPAIDAERRVLFHVKAPTAHTVAVHGLGSLWVGQPFPLVLGPDGVWSGWSEPADPGFYYYDILVDGVAVNDPGSETFFGWGHPTSGIEIPDHALDFYDIAPVPHGEVRARTYFSNITGASRRVVVYTPPDYDLNPGQRYPVLYLQHGSGESERAWTAQGRAQFICDNLTAHHQAVAMLVVMELGYASKEGAPPPANGANALFEDLVVDDLVPMIDATYRTIAARESRAIAGLSMGAGQAIKIAFDHPELFASVAAFSGGFSTGPVGPPEATRIEGLAKALQDPAECNRAMRLVWIGCGQQDNAFMRAHDAHAALDKADIHHVWFEIPGGHDWQVWRKSLHDLAPRLFQGR